MDLIGKNLGNYRIDRLLGEGGTGVVYQAYDLSLQRVVAIKLIHPHLARRPDFRQRFLQEARLMARLDHPGIVRVYSLGKAGDFLFLPIEYIEGGNLRQLLDTLIQEHKWLPLNEALLLVQQLCEVVEYAYQKGVLHRDIRPANLMLKPEPTGGLPFRVILTDLGLAKLLEGLRITQEGTSLGMPAYMSPEQALGREIDPRSEVYSLGILLYELSVGRLPFPIRTLTDALHYHMQEPPAPRSFRPDVPESVERVILKSLQKHPGQRYSGPADLRAALDEIVKSSSELVQPANQYEVSLFITYQASVLGSLGEPSRMSLESDVALIGSSDLIPSYIPQSKETLLEVISKDHTPRVIALTPGSVTIGRAKDNTIVIDDQQASRRHAEITWDGQEYGVTDLQSTNGTYLENSRLLPDIPEIWRPDQMLRIGDTWLRLIEPAKSTGSLAAHMPASDRPVDAVLARQRLTVEPGGQATTRITLINGSPHVDHFTLSLTGIPTDWIVDLPSSVDLMPGEQKEVALTVRMPRTPQSTAGQHVLTLRVSSASDPSQRVEARLALMVEGYARFKLSVAHPRLLSKQLSSTFLVQIYAPAAHRKAERYMRASFDLEPGADDDKQVKQHTYDGNLPVEQTVKIKLFSPAISFSEPVVRKLSGEITPISFVGKPDDNCQPGLHSVGLSVTDEQTGVEYQSVSFQVPITDYAFDHVSRPLLSNLMAVILGVGSFVMFLLTLLGQIDTTFGLASGTAGAALVSAIHMRTLWLYQRPTTTNLP